MPDQNILPTPASASIYVCDKVPFEDLRFDSSEGKPRNTVQIGLIHNFEITPPWSRNVGMVKLVRKLIRPPHGFMFPAGQFFSSLREQLQMERGSRFNLYYQGWYFSAYLEGCDDYNLSTSMVVDLGGEYESIKMSFAKYTRMDGKSPV